MTALKGMTWNHPRGLDPLLAASAAWAAETGTTIAWDARSLQDFETYPLEDLAAAYDLIVIDHPHVGGIVDAGCLVPFTESATLAEIAAGSVGASFPSYRYAGRQWALPIDAAAQVQAWVPGRIDGPVADWHAILSLAREGRLACPLRPPHALMTLFTLCGQLERSPDSDGDILFDGEIGPRAWSMLAKLADAVGPDARHHDPIAILDAMSERDSAIAVAPYIYGYVSYARDGFRPARIAFTDLAPVGVAGSAGSALGGTGIAVSARSDDIEAARAFACWVASGPVQATLYAANGGQPGHDAAWRDATVNAATGDFFAATRQTLDAAWLRPRHAGYMRFQHEASALIDAALGGIDDGASVIARLNDLHRRHRR
ncbi:multiple sugar transport system substrate-binding protein [Sphingomonas jinjuensis]|uniref:Multiple sugar transport system substrate-binding protein n=1 Tax=Sphingomonas jinjuensis TaxID=535907 RepID=A0A840F322_9SPHN|nr:extracellular solute-binding protein [Sphingomonas jinjuensis]MBB4152230.1 multiple sugar transport system substrate-binding protein [Sphingomonas jinjuensis]